MFAVENPCRSSARWAIASSSHPSSSAAGSTGSGPSQALQAVYDCMHVFMGDDGARIRTRLERGVQVHHVAMIAEGVRDGRIEVGHPDEPVNGVPAASQTAEPARQEDGEPAVPVHVARRTEPGGGQRVDAVVERGDEVFEEVAVDRIGVLRRDVDLDPATDPFENAADRHVIAGARESPSRTIM